MYEEEDDLPPGFAYGLGASSLELRMRMQAYWEQQFALRNAMSVAAAGGNFNSLAAQPPLSLRDYYQRFAQQYPSSLTTNQYVFPPPQIPTNANNAMMTPSLVSPQSPSLSSHSSSPTKSPISASHNRRLSVPPAPYSINNSQRNRRLSANPMTAEEPHFNLSKSPVSLSLAIPKSEPVDPPTSIPSHDIFATHEPYPSFTPFTTQLPNHIQQFHLPDFVPSQDIPAHSIPLDKIAHEDQTDLFTVHDWTSFLTQPQAPSKITPYDDGTNWEDYLDGDAGWLVGSQHGQDS
jgi:hypothetical protein